MKAKQVSTQIKTTYNIFSQILLSSSRSIDEESEGEHNTRERVESLTIHQGHLC